MKRFLLWIVRHVTLLVLAILLVAAGYFLRGWAEPEGAAADHGHAHVSPSAAETIEWWTCSMHPQIRQPKPGKCPICGMDLIPLKSGGGAGPRSLTVSEDAMKLMEIQTRPVEQRFVTAEVRLVGKVDYDETRLSYIAAWVPGRIDRMFVDYTGVAVQKGDHMVELYSPDLLAAQEELIQAVKAVKSLENSPLGIMKETAEATVKSVREKLRLLGLKDEQVRDVETRGKPADHITIYAPAGGIVIQKNAQQGMYVETGTRIYTIADLSQVWVRLDAYESDLVWLRYGQRVEFTALAYPGKVFDGKIAFIDPVLNAMTRTVSVRVNVPNAAGMLKPEMFVRAVVRAQVAAGGRVMDPNLAGKWMCRMHPDIVKDSAGTCDICGMPLVRTESLGYVPIDEQDAAKPLVIPASAPLITGKRAVVYVEVPGAKEPTFAGRDVVLGPRAGDYYIVQSGLGKGEIVVTHGNFKIDSSLQIQAKPSMMSSEGASPAPQATTAPAQAAKAPPAPVAFQTQIAGVVTAYTAVSQALAADDLKAAVPGVQATRLALDAADMKLLSGPAHETWMREQRSLSNALDEMAKAKDIEHLRGGFALLSDALAAAVRKFGLSPAAPLYRLHCPMAFNNRGADWLQKDKTVRNPYFGASMLQCGDVVETLGERKDE